MDGGVKSGWTLVTESAEQTQAAAAQLGGLLVGGDVLGLVGELGAGKTCFAQGLARGLGVAPDQYVRSPTFTLVHHHPGRVPFAHVDLYRLEDADEAAFIGYEDLFDGEAVVAIEWFDRFPELWPRRYLELLFAEGGPNRRTVTVRACGTRPAEVLETWRRSWEGS